MNKLIGLSIVIAFILATVAPKTFVLSTVEARPKLATVKIPPAIEPVKQDIAEIKQPTPVSNPPTGNCELWLAQAGVQDMVNARELIRRENNACDPQKYNMAGSDACGVAQELPCGKSGCGMPPNADGACQVKWMNSYIAARYGSWSAAIAHHDRMNWY